MGLGRNVKVDFPSPVPPSISYVLGPRHPLPSTFSNAALERGSGLLLAPTLIPSACPELVNGCRLLGLSSLLDAWFYCQILCFYCCTHKGSDKHPLGWPVRLCLEPLSFIIIHFTFVLNFKLLLCNKYQEHSSGQDRYGSRISQNFHCAQEDGKVIE